jgi:hypothetical protein
MTARRWSRTLLALCVTALFTGCGGSSSDNAVDSPTDHGPGGVPQGANVLPVTIGGSSLCTQYVNQPCVAVTICLPGTAQCQTVNDILIDTGSIGLRVFRSVLTVDLTPHIARDTQGNQIGECVIFGTGADWGPVATAGVILGQQPQVVVPIQLIDASFAGQSPALNPCREPVDDTAINTGLNGILGIDAFSSDQGAGLYFSCTAQSCSRLNQPPAFVQNPIAMLPGDNNGYVVTFPGVASGGSPTVTGAVIMGVGTQPNNSPASPAGLSVLSRDPRNGLITTSYKGTTYPSFLDTGSTFLFLPDDTIPLCRRIDGAYCPSSSLTLSGTNIGLNQLSTIINFQVANAENLEATGNSAFNNLAGPNTAVAGTFDWGLPFFLGRTVYTGLAGKNTVLGIGPYWAY